MHQGIPGESEIEAERETFGDLLSRLATASAGLVRDEIELVKQEVRDKARMLRAGLIMSAIAALLGIIALLTLDAALVIGTGKVIGYGWSALAIGVAIAIVAGIFAGMGISRFKKTKLSSMQGDHRR